MAKAIERAIAQNGRGAPEPAAQRFETDRIISHLVSKLDERLADVP
jgi:hypothetical protein